MAEKTRGGSQQESNPDLRPPSGDTAEDPKETPAHLQHPSHRAASGPRRQRNIEQAVETSEPGNALRRKELTRVREAADQLIAELEKVPDGDEVGQIVNTTIKLLRDNTNRGDIKLINKSLKELRYGLKVFAPYRDFRKVSIFGSARTPEDHPDYKMAEAFGREMEASGWMIITGAGGGIMAAGHGGAGARGSFGLNISLPFEQSANEHIHGDPKLINFKYFFTRKLMFVRSSHAIALFPGGFGTMDEGFEVMTLVQTGKCPPMPLVLVDHPGGDYWAAFDDLVRNTLLADGLISEEDLSLYKITDSIDEAVQETRHFYSNFHSLRYTRDLLVMRLQNKPTQSQLGEIREEFDELCVPGGEQDWTVSGPLKVERNEPKLRHLHRLIFPFNRRNHGRLRQLIDRLNELS